MRNYKYIFIGIALLILLRVFANVGNAMETTTIENVKVVDLQNQQIISGSGKSISTEIRYLVVTENETFIVKSSLINGKFNNSDLFFHLKKDSTYTFKVAGYGKSFWFDYRNVLEAKPYAP